MIAIILQSRTPSRVRSPAKGGHEMSDPQSPLEAVTAADPTGFYAELAQNRPIYRDDAMDMWVVSSAETVTATLACPHLGVRPNEERIPKAIQGTAAGEIFGRLVRMTDGAQHAPLKTAIARAIDSLEPDLVTSACRDSIQLLLPISADHLERFVFNVPVYVVRRLLGFPDPELPRLSNLMRDLVSAFSPLGTAEQIAAGARAAGELLDLISAVNGPLFNALENAMRENGCDLELDLPANAIGLMFQSYEGTAGLIGNVVKRYSAHDLESALLRSLILKSLQYDSVVQNTRRFAHASCAIEGCQIAAGDRLLVVLAAANLDAETPDFSFGAGVHACPGRELALTIAESAISGLLVSGLDFSSLSFSDEYRASLNTRIPLFNVHRGSPG
jgi:cytochrome P450